MAGADRHQQGLDDLLREVQESPQHGRQAGELPARRGAQQIVAVVAGGVRLLRPRGEVDPRRHRGSLVGGLGGPEPAGQREHGPVLGQDLRGEVPDALLRGALGQLAQQGGAQAALLPGMMIISMIPY